MKEYQLTQVCSTEYAFHALLNPELALIESILVDGLRPLSDFPDSERWQQFEKHMPGFYEQLYKMVAEPVIQKPYPHSGIFHYVCTFCSKGAKVTKTEH